MQDPKSIFPVHLFYSYCHKDEVHRERLETALARLRQEGLLETWYDHNILPGETIPDKIAEAMDSADVMVFLFSQNFIASDECMREWNLAKKRFESGRLQSRIPIILSDCAWKDVLRDDSLKALPDDGKPVQRFRDNSIAWQQVYEGIKEVVIRIQESFSPKKNFLNKIQMTDFIAEEKICLLDIFVFPTLLARSPTINQSSYTKNIITETGLFNKNHVIIHGDNDSGKTALARYIYLSFSNMDTFPLYIDFNEIASANPQRIVHNAYIEQYNGDYNIWKSQENKALILENVTHVNRHIVFSEFAKDFFDRIFMTMSSSTYHSFFLDDDRFVDFLGVSIEPLNHNQQEKLVRNKLLLSQTQSDISDGLVDHLEKRVNTVILSNKIVPRYPFYVLSILQAHEKYMPEISITSQGHCYYILIVAYLIKSGISSKDMDINACFNFLENLAHRHYEFMMFGMSNNTDFFDFDGFIDHYTKKYYISKAILGRMQDDEYGVISATGHFRFKYMYLFFLGRFLANNKSKYQDLIGKLCEENHLYENQLILLFVIHHTNDHDIIEDILVRSVCTLENVTPAELTATETSRFSSIISTIRPNILREETVESARRNERNLRDVNEERLESDNDVTGLIKSDRSLAIYRIFMSNQILSQILRNKYGVLDKERIEEIIETISDGGLKLINCFLESEGRIQEIVKYFQKKIPHLKEEKKIHTLLQGFSLMWTLVNIEHIVAAIDVPEIRDGVKKIVAERATPAYRIIGYFNLLESALALNEDILKELKNLLKKDNDRFVKMVVSLRTQSYMNTHRSKAPIEQAFCSALGIDYTNIVKRQHRDK